MDRHHNEDHSITAGLPVPRAVLTALMSSIARTHTQEPSQANDPETSNRNPLKDSPDLRQVFLTLHVFYPNELLPALDLLDRGLVASLCVTEEPPAPEHLDSHTHNYGTKSSIGTDSKRVYHVRSARPLPNNSRYQNHIYEVRLNAWSCSCPAFAFAAFPAIELGVDQGSVCAPSDNDFSFGGLSQGAAAPVCKHLLACVLAEYGGAGFASSVERKYVQMHEYAGWGAGWGD